ncbi:MAG: hypothetical protein AAGA68_20085 [Pseudomonadota bacterium]
MTRSPPPDLTSASQEEEAERRLEALREILSGADQRRLDELARRIQERQLRADDVADVLPEAFVREFDRSPARLTEAVRKPIEHTLREAVRNDPRPIADAIFPIIGPAIRRYITASVRSLAESLSRTIERGLSPRRQLAWRLKAWRSGVSFGAYVLQRTFVYRVEHVYLIQAGSGLLVAEAHHDESPSMDGDAISGMLAALQSFVLDSFELGDDRRLETAQLGDFTLWAIHGPHALLACAIRGVPGNDLRTRLASSLDSIHLRFARELEGFDGTQTVPPAVDEELDACLYLRRADEDTADGKRRIGWPVWVALIVLAALTVRWLVSDINQRMAMERLTEQLATTPGVVATDVVRDRKVLSVHGLRDPLAPTVAELAAAAEVGGLEVIDETEPYQSLEPGLVLQRLSRALDQPSSVELRLDGSVLRVAGVADSEWVDMMDQLVLVSPAIDEVDTSRLRVSDETLLETVRRLLSPPSKVTLGVSDAVLEVGGIAPLAWAREAVTRGPQIAGLREVDISAVRVAEVIEAASLVERIGDAQIYFARGSADYREGGAGAVATAAQDLRRLLRLAEELSRPIAIVSVGHTDGLGSSDENRTLREARAARVRTDLVAAGVPAAAVAVRDAGDATTEDEDLRKAEIRVEMDLSPYQVTPAP